MPQSSFPRILFSSAKEDWGTPQHIFDALHVEFNFVLDAAAASHNAKCAEFFTIDDDALCQNWHTYGRVFCNPPYSRSIGKWVAKARKEADLGATVVLLIPSRTDTKWWHEYIYNISETRFLRGRLKFTDYGKGGVASKNPATFPSVVVVMRPTDRASSLAQLNIQHPLEGTMPKHFTHIRSNVKVPIDSDLKQLNIVVGDNRSGKSSIVTDAIRLALTGKHPIGHYPSQLATLAPAGATDLHVELTNGGTHSASFLMENVSTKSKKPEHRCTLTGDTPSAIAEDILSHDKSKAREAIFSRFGDVKDIPTPVALDEAQQEVWAIGVDEVEGEGAAERLAEMAKWMRKRKLAMGREVKSIEREIETLTGGGDRIGSEELPMLEKQLITAMEFEASESARAAAEFASIQIAAYDEQLERLSERSLEAEESIKIHNVKLASYGNTEAIESSVRRAENARDLISRVLAVRNAGGEVACPVCANCELSNDAMSKTLQVAKETVELRQNQFTGIEVAKKAVNLAAIQFTNILNEQVSVRASKNAVAETAKSMGDVPEYDGPDAFELRQRIGALKEVRAMGETMSRRVEERAQAKLGAGIAKDLEKEASCMLQSLLSTVKSRAESAVNKYMPDNFQVTLNLKDDACEWVVSGQDNRAHSKAAMAGSERAALLVGLALAWTEGQDVRVLSLDDESLAMLSPTNLQALLSKIEAVAKEDESLQVFAAWPASRIDHTDDIPAAWHRIVVG